MGERVRVKGWRRVNPVRVGIGGADRVEICC